MRPRWLKVDPHRAQISDEFLNWCEQWGIEVVDSAGNAKEQQGKVEHNAQLFELMLEDILADVQPQTEYESCQSPVSLRCSRCSDAIRRSLAIHMIHSDMFNARRALDTRSRVVPTFLPGDTVAVHDEGRWHPQENAHTTGICKGPVRGNYWIAHHRSVVSASPEQLRPVSR